MFVISKLLSAVTQPLFWLATWWGLALLLLNFRRSVAVAMLWGGLAVLGILGFRSIPDALLRTLENRYSIPGVEIIDHSVGLIVLGGATGDPEVFQAHGQVPLGESAERMTVSIALMRQHPKWELVFSGGEGRLFAAGVTEAQLAKVFYQEQGLDMARLKLENGSRSTRENARFVTQMLGDRCKQPWLLVSSAWHLPRAMNEFSATGCNVIPYPVDFRTGDRTHWTEYSLANSLLRWQMALHEWLGLLVYELTR